MPPPTHFEQKRMGLSCALVIAALFATVGLVSSEGCRANSVNSGMYNGTQFFDEQVGGYTYTGCTPCRPCNYGSKHVS